MRLDGKVALVTGATRGIGRGIAHVLAREGAHVVLAGRTVADGEAAAREITAAGGSALYVQADVAVEADVVRAVARVVERFGRLTTLVNNAAATHLPEHGDAGLAELENAVMSEALATNLWGLFWCCKHVIPEMTKAGGGSIVNVSSGVATKGAPGMDAYTATKGAMNALTRSLAVGYAKRRIRVNAIACGFVASAGADDLLADPERRRWLETIIPLPYFGAPEDVAWGCVYLASDESRYVTGAVLPIDGGYLACPA